MRFGTVFSMDYDRRLRLMAICPVDERSPHWSRSREIWGAMVIDDPAYLEPSDSTKLELGWRTGAYITFDPNDRGLQVVEDE